MWTFLRAALRIAPVVVILNALSLPLQTAPVPAAAYRLTFISFAAGLPPPVDRFEIRQAVAQAVDRQALAAIIPGAYPAAALNHPRLPGYNSQVRSYNYDPARAKALVTQTGWDTQSRLRIYLATSYRGEAWDRIQVKILENLDGAGIKAEFVLLSFDALIRLVKVGGGAAYVITWTSDKADFGYPYFSVGIPQLMKSAEGADQLTRQFEQAADVATKERIAQDLERLVLDRALIVPLFFRD